jgi:hypothetical protein
MYEFEMGNGRVGTVIIPASPLEGEEGEPLLTTQQSVDDETPSQKELQAPEGEDLVEGSQEPEHDVWLDIGAEDHARK